MEPARVALDAQALQEGSGAAPAQRRRVVEFAASLSRQGRLAAALIAPELPPPDITPLREGVDRLLRWDTRTGARELLSDPVPLVHFIPAPLLHAGPGDRGGMVVSRHWTEAGVPTGVYLDGADLSRLAAGPDGLRVQARLEWIRTADRIVAQPEDRSALEALGIDPSRIASPGPGPDADADADASEGQRGNRVVLPYRLAVFGPFPPGGGGIGAYNARFVEAVAASGRAQVDAVTVSGMGWDPPAGVGLIHAESFGTDVRPSSYDWVVYTLGNSDGHLATVEAALRHPGWLWLHEARLPAIATTSLASLDDTRFGQVLTRVLERAYPGRPPLAAARAAGRSHLALAAGGVGLTAPLAERSAGILVNSTAARHAFDLDLTPMAWRPPTEVLPPACPRPPDNADEARSEDDLVVAFGVVSMGKRPDLLVDAAAQAGSRLAFVGPCPEILEMVIRDRATARGIADRVQVTGRLDDAGYWSWLGRATLAVQLRDSAGGEMSAAVLDALAAGVPVVTNLPSAADYPPGTLELLADSTPQAAVLAATIGGLLGEAGAPGRARLSAAGRHFARTHQMSHLAEQVLAVLRGHLSPAALS